MVNLKLNPMKWGFFYPIAAREGRRVFADHPELVKAYTPVAEGINCEISRYVDTSSIDDRPKVTRVSVGSDYYISFWGGDITDIRPASGDVPMRRLFDLQQKIVPAFPHHQPSGDPANENINDLQQQDLLNQSCLNQSSATYASGRQKDGDFVTYSIRPNTGPIDIVSWGFDRYLKDVEKIYARARNGVVGRLLGRPYKYFRIDKKTLEQFYTPDNPPLRIAEIVHFPVKQDRSARLEH